MLATLTWGAHGLPLGGGEASLCCGGDVPSDLAADDGSWRPRISAGQSVLQPCHPESIWAVAWNKPPIADIWGYIYSPWVSCALFCIICDFWFVLCLLVSVVSLLSTRRQVFWVGSEADMACGFVFRLWHLLQFQQIRWLLQSQIPSVASSQLFDLKPYTCLLVFILKNVFGRWGKVVGFGANEVNFILLGSFLLAFAIEEVGLHHRLALKILSMVPGDPKATRVLGCWGLAWEECCACADYTKKYIAKRCLFPFSTPKTGLPPKPASSALLETKGTNHHLGVEQFPKRYII